VRVYGVEAFKWASCTVPLVSGHRPVATTGRVLVSGASTFVQTAGVVYSVFEYQALTIDNRQLVR
jgi:hypothetical protein